MEFHISYNMAEENIYQPKTYENNTPISTNHFKEIKVIAYSMYILLIIAFILGIVLSIISGLTKNTIYTIINFNYC